MNKQSTYHILKETKEKKTYAMVSSGLDQPNDFAWAKVPGQSVGAVELITERESVSCIIGAGWARRGFSKSVKPGDKIFAIDLDTKEKIHVFSAKSDGSWTDHTYKLRN